ncbi:MAG: ferrous iron transport protein B [Fibrobacterales bacterium]
MKQIRIALVGQPNVGKTLLINSVSGSKLKVGNFAGVTVEKKEISFEYEGHEIIITDLPGTYSLNDYTLEERVTKTYLLNDRYDMILNVLDSTNLERNLYLTTELLELDAKMVCALNMSDEAKKENIHIDASQLSTILGIPCHKVSAATKEGIELLIKEIVSTYTAEKKAMKVTYSEAIEEQLETIQSFLESKNTQLLSGGFNVSHRRAAVLLLQEDAAFYKVIHEHPIWIELSDVLKKCLKQTYDFHDTKDMLEIFHEERYAFAKGATLETVKVDAKIGTTITEKIDSLLIHKVFGLFIFLGFMYGLFEITFTLGAVPMDYIDALFSWFGDTIGGVITNDAVRSLIVDGIIAGVGAVVMFLPNIIILFIGIALLENTGYMSRVAFLLDGLFHKFGLHGKSFIPLVAGFGCSVPAYMSARILKNEKDRIITMFIIGFMSCGAKLPIFVVFCGAFFPQAPGLALFLVYILGILIGLISAKILKITAFKGQDEPFVMEMPKYRAPSLRLMWNMVSAKSFSYLKKAGTYILAASMIIWFASNYPKNLDLIAQAHSVEIAISEDYAKQIVLSAELIHQQGIADTAITQEHTIKEIEAATKELEATRDGLIAENNYTLQKSQLEKSALGIIGKATNWFFEPLGFDWRQTVALEMGLLAKEVAISTLGILYALGDDVDAENESLPTVLKKEVPMNSAVAFMLFSLLYLPCLAAVSVFKKEAGGFKYVAYLFLFTTAVAWIVGFIGYHVTNIFI